MRLRSIHGRYLFASAAFIVLTACSGSAEDGGGVGGTPSEGGGGSGPQEDPCPDGKLCLTVVPAGDPAPGNFAIVWFRFEGSTGYDPTVAFEQPFQPGTERLEVALAALSPPPDKTLLCERACADVDTCPCTGEFRAGIGVPIILHDGDMNGRIDLPEFGNPDNFVGVASGAVVWSATAAAPAPAPFDARFPQGVTAGFGLYRAAAAGTYTPAAAGTRFNLKAGTDAF